MINGAVNAYDPGPSTDPRAVPGIVNREDDSEMGCASQILGLQKF